MGLKEKIRMFRELHHLSQEEMANRMNMSLSGYAKLERGETKLHYDKLVQIAQIFNIDVVDLIDSDKGVVFFMNENGDNTSANYYSSNESMIVEVEKLKLILSHKDELLEQKQKEIESLQKIIRLLEK
ncbi:helix-turn-helix domain-containing protein [Neisseria sp. ZJ106]|uniref:Helix-turn-helix domain-containing protein n=1 Tax=Neisseria lisongii TaxID=2912188 RepID=A0AAW5AM61_9NEIS|nr:helix-turn-helix transcriptional regulator [Neisseria lisongii]MCF7521980.1 helix-turn-helix domain-containing protein [Neisseria lisongii]MCF7530591.1 helix-turn-helix domain-containing protein [Neisseria lisongii]WCL71354.1 helix-turn-helix transcriptional regulator [Neisseria lisongii]